MWLNIPCFKPSPRGEGGTAQAVTDVVFTTSVFAGSQCKSRRSIAHHIISVLSAALRAVALRNTPAGVESKIVDF